MLPDSVIIPISHIRRRLPMRPPGYWADVMRHATPIDEHMVAMRRDDYLALKAKYRQSPKIAITRAPGLPVADLTGFDPEDERRRLRTGGCCGAPSVADGTP